MKDEMREALAAFYALCEQNGRPAKMWRESRQVYLGKNKPRESDGFMRRILEGLSDPSLAAKGSTKILL